jgi:hypothetical protein
MWAAKIQTVAVTSTQTPMDFQLEDWEQSRANLFSACLHSLCRNPVCLSQFLKAHLSDNDYINQSLQPSGQITKSILHQFLGKMEGFKPLHGHHPGRV